MPNPSIQSLARECAEEIAQKIYPEWEQLRHDNQDFLIEIEQIITDKLSPRLDELLKDEERLNWLESKPVDGFIMAMTDKTLFDWSVQDSKSLRQAISQAIDEKK